MVATARGTALTCHAFSRRAPRIRIVLVAAAPWTPHMRCCFIKSPRRPPLSPSFIHHSPPRYTSAAATRCTQVHLPTARLHTSTPINS